MSLFDKMREPVFLKESSNAELQLKELQSLLPLLNEEGQAKVRQDMKYIEYGLIGEKNIAYELKNSHMPMYILHDIYLSDGNLSAQIDYLVFTKKICFIIECKNLYGDIEINSDGDFVRKMEFGGRKKREGIYSPITQNQRHFELMKKMKIDSKSNFIFRHIVRTCFEDSYKSVVVLANSKTILDANYAKKELKEKVIRLDQLVHYIKERVRESKEAEVSEGKLLTWAKFYLELHKEVEKGYTSKYEHYRLKREIKQKAISPNHDESEIFKELKAFRLVRSREENIKPYYIYNDSQLKELILKMPRNKAELQSINGFGEVKVHKYGDDLIQILRKY